MPYASTNRTYRFIAFLIIFLTFGFLLSVHVEAQWLSSSSSEYQTHEQKRYANRVLKVIDASEVDNDGMSNLVITFSIPLKTDQNFNDYVHLVDEKTGKVDGAWIVSKSGQELRFDHIEPNRKLVLSIDEGLLSIANKGLDKEYTTKIQTKDLRPTLGFASKGSLFPMRLAEGIPVVALNVKQATVEFFRIKNDQLISFFSQSDSNSSMANWNSDDLLKMADLVYTGGFKLNTERNRRETVMLPIASIKPLQESGVYFAVLRQSGTYSYDYPTTIFTISDIGVSAHRYKNGDSLTVFTQSLKSGQPISNVEISILDDKGHVIQTAKTNDKGYVELSNMGKAELVLAVQDGQTTMLRLGQSSLDLSEFKVDGFQNQHLEFFTFGPRDLYRPGETVYINSLLRDQDGRQVSDIPVTVEIHSADGKVIRSFIWKPHAKGFYQYQFKLDPAAATGDWSFILKVGKKELQTYNFHVEDFLPERLALELKANPEPISSQDPLTVNVSGRYLYGAPANGNLLSGQIYISPLKEAVSQLPGYVFGNEQKTDIPAMIDIDAFPLDKEGKGEIHLDSKWQKVKFPLQLKIQASLQETGGRPIVRTVTQNVWPAKQLVGIHPLFKGDQTNDNSNVSLEIVLADDQGHKLQAKGLKARFIRERHDYYWSYSSDTGWRSGYHQKDLVMDEQSFDIADGTTAKLTYPVEWGFYRLEIENPATGLVTSYRFNSGYDWQQNGDSDSVRPDQVKLKLDKPAYKANDIAHITVTPPAAGNGYIMVESSDGLLWWQEIDVPATGKMIDIPVDPKWQRHDIYVSTLIVRPGDRKIGATPKRAVGILHLPLDRQERKINLALSAPEKMEPSQNLKVKIKATDQNGQPIKNATILLSAVDSGILNITDFKTPDPFNGFFGRKAYGVDQLDVYGQLIETGKGRIATMAFGGDAASMSKGGKKPDTTVNIVALQSVPVTLNDQGEAEIPLFIPDFNGELRIMGQIWTDDAFGVAEDKVVVAAPVVVELSTPRFLAGGDQSVMALDLSNLTQRSQELTVNLQSEGFVQLTGPHFAKVNLAKRERKTISIPVAALQGMGKGIVHVSVANILRDRLESTREPATIKRQWSIGVRPAYPAQLTTLQNRLEQTKWTAPQTLMDGLETSGREGILSLSSRPPLNLSQQIQSLQAYPYGCAEQTTSGLYVSLYTNPQLLKQLGIKTDQTDQQRRDAIDTGIGRLLGMQRYNGSFGLWDSNSEEEYWVSVYVTDFLLRAHERGYFVPEAALQKAEKRLQVYLQNKNAIGPGYSDNITSTQFAVQAYAGYVLARTQQAPLGALRVLYQYRGQAPSGLSLIQLSAALKLMGDPVRADQVLQEGLVKTRNQSKRYWWIGDYGSALRDDALILSLLQEYKMVDSNVIYQRLLELSRQIIDKRYLSTQEQNSVFLAGYQLLSAPEKLWQAEVNIADKHYSLSDKNSSMSFSDEEMRQIKTLEVQNKTNGVPLYQTVQVTGYPEKVPAPSSSHGLHIYKEYLDLNGNQIDLKLVKSGTLLIVRLHLSTENRVNDALVVDFLPAGLELENQNLAQASASLDNAAAAVKGYLKTMEKAQIVHQEFRDDRYVAQIDLGANYIKDMDILYLARAVTPGEYRIPPASVESMYRPEWRAISNAAPVMTVIKR